jgi:hypothetical protein
LKSKDDFRNAFPKSQVPDKTPVFLLVVIFPEKLSLGDGRRSGRPTLLSEVSGGKIPHSLLKFPRKLQFENKNCKYIGI